MQNQVATCAQCNNQFNIVPQEQEFLQERGLPMPKECPSCRQARRLSLRGDRKLNKTKCSKCGKDIVVAFNPEEVNNPILCKEDYEQYFVDNDVILSDPLPQVQGDQLVDQAPQQQVVQQQAPQQQPPQPQQSPDQNQQQQQNNQ